MGAYSNIEAYFNKKIVEVAKESGYSNSNILILEGNSEGLKTNHPDVFDAIMSCTHNRDNRSPLLYAQDLVSSWLFEDHICKTLNNDGLCVELAGADKNREILKNNKVSASSDTTVSFNGKQRVMEIMTDYNGYWKKNKVIDLRDFKYDKLKKSKSLFLGISVLDHSYILIDFSQDVEAVFIAHHRPYGGKSVYQIPCETLKNMDSIIESIKATL